jgi:hypothetical protein
MAWRWTGYSLEDLASSTGNAEPGSINHTAGMAKFTFRQTKAQIAASDAQIEAARAETKAANAAITSAHAAEKNAKYMLWSVIAAALSAVASLISTAIAVFGQH